MRLAITCVNKGSVGYNRIRNGFCPRTKMFLVREADRLRIAQRFIAGFGNEIETVREADG